MDELQLALQTFILESNELLQEMEESLLQVEAGASLDERMDAIFRAAHTIKGSAGLFGLDFIVHFTHEVETVLDRLRAKTLTLTPSLPGLLLHCCDHLQQLIEVVGNGVMAVDRATAELGESLTAQLKRVLNPESDTGMMPAVMPAPDTGRTALVSSSETPSTPTGQGVTNSNWHISLRFGADVFKMGMDPLSFLRYLNTIGDILSIKTLADGMPPLELMDAESCYLGFEIMFQSEADKQTIESVFEFVKEDCRIQILPPHAKITEYQSLITELPETLLRLGEILVAVGALTDTELDHALQLQSQLQERGGEGSLCPIGQILVDQHFVAPTVVEAALEKQRGNALKAQKENQSIRIDARRLDELINLIGELVIAGSSVNLIAQKTAASELLESTATMSRLVEAVRDSTLQLRMVQIGGVFSRFQRVVRDVSQELNKPIRLEVSGAETELDKTVVEKISDPLTHLVRNAMDHGIEPKAVRQARGKPEEGVLQLNAYHDSGHIVIEVQDDGGGLPRERILQKAIERGLVQPTQTLSEYEIDQLIFEPGFSTAETITNLSGRGVGMDVVKRNISALRGTIHLDSQPEKGTRVRIRLPLTLAIIDGFLVQVADSVFVVPLENILECMELSANDRLAIKMRNYINLRGEVLPCIRLRHLFSLDHTQPSRRENVVVVKASGKKVGLIVDRLLGEFQTVIKPLAPLFAHLRGIGGSTILGSGAVALILDIPGLIEQTAHAESKRFSLPSFLEKGLSSC